MSTRNSPNTSPKAGLTILTLNWLGRILTYLLSLASPLANRGFLWRVAAALNFREIKLRHVKEADIAEPYVRLERFFAHDEVYLGRFANLVTGEKIFLNLLKSNWFLNLTLKERITVTSLFRRVENFESIILTLNRRPVAKENLGTLENVDQDSLPQHLFTKEEPRYSKMQDSLFGFRKFLNVGPASVYDATLKLFAKTFGFIKGSFMALVSLLLLIFVVPFTALEKIGLKSNLGTSIRSSAARKKLALLIKMKSPAAKVSKLLSHYEMNYGHNESAVEALGEDLKKPFGASILTANWLNVTPLEHRVFVTSLLRKVSASSPDSVNIFEPITAEIHTKYQRNIPQITGVSVKQKEELKLFKREKLKSLTNPREINRAADAPAISRRDPISSEFSLMSSEEVLRKEGWGSQKINGLDLFEVLKSRNFSDLTKIFEAEDLELILPGGPKEKLASIAALTGTPVKSTNPSFKDIPPNLKAAPRTFESETHMARLRNNARANLLSYEDNGDLTLRLIWMRLANKMQDQVEFSQNIDTLLAAYDAHPFAKVTLRSVSFDTFIILELNDILDRMKIWIEWETCGRSSLVALAHLATLTHDAALFDLAISYIEPIRGVPKAFTSSLKNSYFSVGLHNLEAVITGDISGNQPLTALDKNKNYLCFVEGGAGIRALRKLDGLSDKVLCAPVIPTDSARYPSEVTLRFIDDLIPKYSKRDMELAFEVDALVDAYITKASEAIRATGVNERYAEAVEIAHAIMFFGMYQEALAVELCETLLKDAKPYDGVIFLLNSADVMSNLIPETEALFGRENVFIGLENERSKGFDVALKNIRHTVSPRKVKKSVQAPESTEWETNFVKWVSTTMSTHEKRVVDLPEDEYALLTLEHINGYFDSYVSLTEQSLKHMDVEIFTSRANPTLNDYILEGNFDNGKNTLTQCTLNERALSAVSWTSGLAKLLENAFDDIENPWFPKYKAMMHERASSVLSGRLPQVFEAVSYFRARFSYNRPEYVFTGPNQHIVSRAASYAALALEIPVYDFLILASTHHPRYRYPVAKYSYIYDPWYSEIFEDHMRMPKENIRVSGPLFDYGQRLKQSSEPAKGLKNKTHIIFFSQSGNFQNSCNMLEGICKGSKGFDEIFITVKMHPHESPANLKRYQEFAAKFGVKDNIRLIHHGDAVALINEADLVVQSFSNIGLDSLLMKKPVITFKPPSDLTARLFLYEKDIGYIVKTKTALAKKVKSFLSDPKDKQEMQIMADTFAAENEHFLRSDNAERVMLEVLQDIGKA